LGYAWATKISCLAERLIQACASRHRDAAALAVTLAETIGDVLEPTNRLVAAVLAGGPFVLRRALDLAELILESNARNVAVGDDTVDAPHPTTTGAAPRKVEGV